MSQTYKNEFPPLCINDLDEILSEGYMSWENKADMMKLFKHLPKFMEAKDRATKSCPFLEGLAPEEP